MNKAALININSFTSPSGDKMVILLRADYNRLLEASEDLADIAAYDLAKARIAAGEDELVPSDVAKRLISGENPVRVWRDYRGFSGKDLAAACDIAPAYLSQIENGGREGSLKTMKQIAKVLKLTIDELV